MKKSIRKFDKNFRCLKIMIVIIHPGVNGGNGPNQKTMLMEFHVKENLVKGGDSV